MNEGDNNGSQVLRTVKCLKNGKNSWKRWHPDGAIEACGVDCTMPNLLDNVWQNKVVHTEWRNGIIVPLPKKETCQTATTDEASHCYQQCLQA